MPCPGSASSSSASTDALPVPLAHIRQKTHVPYRDSKLTRLLSPALGGGALALPLVHVRMDRFEEAEAVLLQCAKLTALSTDVKGTTAAAAARAAGGGWWSPAAELSRAEEKASALALSLGMERAGLLSSAIQLDMEASDELLALQETLLRSERLAQRLEAWAKLRAGSSSTVQASAPQQVLADELSELQVVG